MIASEDLYKSRCLSKGGRERWSPSFSIIPLPLPPFFFMLQIQQYEAKAWRKYEATKDAIFADCGILEVLSNFIHHQS